MDAEDLATVLARFHRQVLLPDVERVVSGAVTGSETRLRDEMHAGFDAIAQRLDRLETEYHMLVAGLRRVEERLDGMEKQFDRLALKAELEELKTRVGELQQRIVSLEARL